MLLLNAMSKAVKATRQETQPSVPMVPRAQTPRSQEVQSRIGSFMLGGRNKKDNWWG